MNTRLVTALKTYGVALPLVVMRKLISKFITAETVIVYEQVIPRSHPMQRHSSLAVDVHLVADHTSRAFIELCEKFPQKDFARRWCTGRECYVAYYNGELCGYAWVARSNLKIDEIALEYQVCPREIFIYDCFVDSAYRGIGIYPSMLEAILKDFRAKGYDSSRALIASSSVNKPSIRGIAKAGFRELKRIHYLQWRRYQRWWEYDAPGRPKHGATC